MDTDREAGIHRKEHKERRGKESVLKQSDPPAAAPHATCSTFAISVFFAVAFWFYPCSSVFIRGRSFLSGLLLLCSRRFKLCSPFINALLDFLFYPLLGRLV